uniref:Ycf55 n=1 Tax=Riquetophycus sp. TaxID=1897556 RepID=A0A1C9C888_9FLOR|nr:hypothetical protein Riqu_121 [Riquetophycus sp.]
MIMYWPYKQGINLNSEVGNLFFNTRQKFSDSLSNQTNDTLYIDMLDNSSRKKLFSSILTELEILILDIVELDLNINNIKSLNHKILYDLIEKSLHRFLSQLKQYFNIIIRCEYNQENYYSTILSEHKLLLENLLIYLIFGSCCINSQIFTFEKQYTPKEHVSILLENLIIQISNLVIFIILDNIKSLSKITSFIKINALCNNTYMSIRSLALFRNNLVIQHFIYIYIYKPKEIYSSRYKVWLISSKGLIAKYISITRLDDFSKLSTIQLILILLIEVQDIIIPKLEKLLLILSKIIIYIFINFLGNSIIFCIRAILAGIHSINK